MLLAFIISSADHPVALTVGDIFHKPGFMFYTTDLNLALTLALLKQTLHSTNFSDALHKAGLSGIKLKSLMLCVLLGTAYSFIEAGIYNFLRLPDEELIELINRNLTSPVAIFYTVSAICVIGPVFEEVVFRGILYQRIVQSRIGVPGAIVMPDIFFSFAHQHTTNLSFLAFYLPAPVCLAGFAI